MIQYYYYHMVPYLIDSFITIVLNQLSDSDTGMEWEWQMLDRAENIAKKSKEWVRPKSSLEQKELSYRKLHT